MNVRHPNAQLNRFRHAFETVLECRDTSDRGKTSPPFSIIFLAPCGPLAVKNSIPILKAATRGASVSTSFNASSRFEASAPLWFCCFYS
jgi:hypothetical protein